jgi:di/tricarboxylate transporter
VTIIFFRALFILLLALTMLAPGKLGTYASLVDWPTIATLAGLLVLTKSLEASGYLTHLGVHLIALMPTERALAFFLVLATAALSMFLTNDVALFVVVPLTLGLRATMALPTTRLIVFEALAANAGSALTPIGNPQNLFLWQISQISFGSYCLSMLPLLAIVMAVLLLMTSVTFAGRKLSVEPGAETTPVVSKLRTLSLLLYLPFLVLTDLHFAVVALLLVLMIFFFVDRNVLARTDWGLILVFILMFVDLRLLAQQPLIRTAIESIGLAHSPRLYIAGIIASQLISNVPAAILLAEYTKDWRLIAYAVNVGGFGFVLGSLANLIALRMARKRSAWVLFHAYSLPFLLLSGSLVYVYLFMG